MPLIIKAGVSRKVSADFQSRGYTLDIQSEFDPRTLDDTNTLADAADHLFQLANNLIEHQVRKAAEDGQGRDEGTATSHAPTQVPTRVRPAEAAARNGGNGHPQQGNNRGRGHGNGPRPVTEAQVRAVTNMAKRLRVDADVLAGENFDRPVRELSIRQGSELIDLLKDEIASQEAKGAFR